MGRQSAAADQEAASRDDVFQVVANFPGRSEYGTMILDRVGRILSCGTPAERIFGASQVHLIGRMVSDFVAGLLLGGSSPSFSARYLVYLCADGEWRKFDARDASGRTFVLELNLARMATVGKEREMFLMNLRCPRQEREC